MHGFRSRNWCSVLLPHARYAGNELTKEFLEDTLGTSNAAAGMVLLMLPEFFFALYEKNGMHLETILTNFISVRFKRPAVRRYEVENLYERELETAAPIQKKGGILGKK